MKKSKAQKKDTITLILLLLFAIVTLVLDVVLSKNGLVTGFLALSILLLASQLKKMNIKI